MEKVIEITKDLFEDGRQDALSAIEWIVARRAKFNKECIEDSTTRFAYTKEQMKAFDQIYSEIQICIGVLKTKKRNSKIFGQNHSTNQSKE